MTHTGPKGTSRTNPSMGVPYHVRQASFERPDAEEVYGPDAGEPGDFRQTHLPDEVTRDLAKRMHYSAWRLAGAEDEASRRRWQSHYLHFRDCIVLGNHKLVYRAVSRWKPPPACAEDMVGDCLVVLIKAVAAYNPWLGVRFSTYGFTCLMRALSRLSQKAATDRLARALPLEAAPDGEPCDPDSADREPARLDWLDLLLRPDNDLLSLREKRVLVRRFSLDEKAPAGTLAQVGRELGLSKERVRQVQASALGKLRAALLSEVQTS